MLFYATLCGRVYMMELLPHGPSTFRTGKVLVPLAKSQSNLKPYTWTRFTKQFWRGGQLLTQ